MSKRKAQELEGQMAQLFSAQQSKHSRQAAAVPAMELREMLPKLKTEHELRTQGSMPGLAAHKSLALSLQVPADPRAETEMRRKFSFLPENEPALIKNWCGVGGKSIMGPGGLYTPIRSLGAQHSGYADMGSIAEASAWQPMVPAQVGGIDVPNLLPPNGVLIGSRDGKSAYHLTKVLGGGTYGGVFFALRVNVKDMQDIPNSGVALKIMRLHPEAFVDTSQPGVTKKLSPKAVNGAFIQYVFQRSYGGCMPFSVCMHDAFLLAIPLNSLPGNINWNAVIVMENMQGSLLDLVRAPEILNLPVKRRYSVILNLICKMVRAIFDLELQRIFHDDIKPQNFLFRKLSDGEYEVKVTDFDLGSFAGRTQDIIDNFNLQTAIIKESTRGNLDRTDQNWGNVRSINYLLGAQASTTAWYSPPEYDLVKLLNSGMQGEDISAEMANKQRRFRLPLPTMAVGTIAHVSEFTSFKNKNVYNADWLSRMMAFELICTMRHIFLDAGLAPHYTVHHTYPADILVPNGPMVTRGAHTLIRMAAEGAQNIVPPVPAYTDGERLRTWRHLREQTVSTTNVDQSQIWGVTAINTMIANVIAPKTPEVTDPATYFPMEIITTSAGIDEMLCANQENFKKIRPTVGEVLTTLMDAVLHEGRARVPEIQSPAIPVSVQTALSADLIFRE